MWHSPYCAEHIHLKEVDSTNTELLKRASEGAPEGTIVTADRQIAGRGQRGRKWVSPSLKGLYYSILFRPVGPLEKISLMTLMAGIAVYETITQICALKADLKWPNDILIKGRKVAGILTESTWEGQKPTAVVIGVGLNLSFHEADFPTDIIFPATSLVMETGTNVSREILFTRMTDMFYFWNKQLWAEKNDTTVAEWMARSSLMGKNITLSAPQGVFNGTVTNISPQGHIQLKLNSGDNISLNSGTILSIQTS